MYPAFVGTGRGELFRHSCVQKETWESKGAPKSKVRSDSEISLNLTEQMLAVPGLGLSPTPAQK